MAKKRKDVVSFFRRNSLTTLDEIWSKKSFAVCVALIIRFSIGLGSYSGKPLHLNHLYDSIGAQTSPTYGDFEAQRHWMEVTIHLPIKEWSVFIPSSFLCQFQVSRIGSERFIALGIGLSAFEWISGILSEKC